MERLLIAGNDGDADFMSKVARECGYVVRSASSHDEFRNELRSFAPTVVSLDLTSRALDGIELLGIVANEGSRPAVLLVTAYDERVTAAAQRVGIANDLPMAGIIAKPARPECLRTILNDLKLSGSYPSRRAG